MKNRILVEEPIIETNRIICHYTVEGAWSTAFKQKDKVVIEYSIDISSVPMGIAIVPFLANVLPMAWVYDAEIAVPICDKAFYNSIPEFKKGYQAMYPMMSLGGQFTVGKLEENVLDKNGQSGAFFSGGVDAFNTLVCHAKEKPVLLTLWGADVHLDDVGGWKNVLTQLQETSRQFGVDYVTIKSEFKMFQNEDILTKAVAQSGDGWWHGFQHGIGIICHAAPVAWVLKLSTVYFASTFTAADRGRVTCASDPTIDNYVRFGGTHVVHDGYEFNRQMKVHNITQFAKKTGMRIPLRVCWESTGGSNCCNCEKCWRTMLAIYAENQNPHEYGFAYTDKQLKKIAQKMRYSEDKMFSSLRYASIQNAMRQNCTKQELPKTIQWFYDADMSALGKAPMWRKCVRKVKQYIRRYIR